MSIYIHIKNKRNGKENKYMWNQSSFILWSCLILMTLELCSTEQELYGFIIVFLSHTFTVLVGIQSDLNCTAQTKLANLSTLTNGGLFAVMDGGRSPKVPLALREILKETILEELSMDDSSEDESLTDMDPLKYLSHTFLTLHRQETGMEEDILYWSGYNLSNIYNHY